MTRHLVLSAAAATLAFPTLALADLFGVTNSDLYRLDPTNVTAPVLVGSLNLPSNFVSAALAYHTPSKTLVLLAYDFVGANAVQQYLYGVNPFTGSTTQLATLGNPTGAGYFESFEYVASRNSLVVSNGNPGSFTTHTLRDIALDGVLGATLFNNGADNDVAVYDSARDILYVSDPNGAGRLLRAPSTDLGPVPLVGDAAYDPASDAFYAVNFNDNHFYRFTTNGVSAVSVNDLGTLAGPPLPIINALAVAPAARLTGDTQPFDNVIDLDDLNHVLNNFGTANPAGLAWPKTEGTVDLNDLNGVLNNFGNHAAAGALLAVPEPTALTMGGLGALAMLTRRRRP